MAREFDGNVNIPFRNPPSAPMLDRGVLRSIRRQGTLGGGSMRRKSPSFATPRRNRAPGLVKPLRHGKEALPSVRGTVRGMIASDDHSDPRDNSMPKPTLRGTGRRVPGAQSAQDALLLNNQPVPHASAVPVRYLGQ
jgi:hypothetical protein